MSNSRGSTASTHTGRPRNLDIDNAVLTATLQLLSEVGYSNLTFEDVAKRAGTSRPAIYRRWPGRPHMTLAAIATRLEVPTPPDTGCTLCDIGEAFDVFLEAYRTIRPDVLSSLYADCAADQDLKQRYMDTLIEPPRAAVSITIDRAIERQNIRSTVDRDTLLDMLASLVHYRAMFGHEHMTPDEAENAIELILRGAAIDYEALLAHSQALEEEHLLNISVPHGKT